ncbi:MAG: ScpA family protein [Candidatus Woesearchaeota archaeon]|nr:ScpA family protein [Candidatus Woesearchaeota archaeon]
MEDRILELLTKDDNITWQALIYDLVKSENMDPWDIDVSLITKKYIDAIKKLEEMNFRVSGKVVLAAAILLKIKSHQLIGENLSELDRLFASAEESTEMIADDFYSGLENEFRKNPLEERPELFPKTPQPRNRKVSMYDLVLALQKALEVKHRRVMREPSGRLDIPEKKMDIVTLINNIYEKLKALITWKKSASVRFSELLPSEKKEDKVFTFIPLLHLANQQKIDLLQKSHFGEIEVALYSAKLHQEMEKEFEEERARHEKERAPRRPRVKAPEQAKSAM